MKTLIINHPLYGRHKITEPVLLELLKSPALLRLKKINQHGAWKFYRLYDRHFTRYQHSLGVFLLLRKFGASLPEQIAGLLHDISHTAFSHVVDRVYGRELTQDYQDSKLELAFKLQGINPILRRHSFKPESILDFSTFTLLENDLPDICADRLDYTFQDPLAQKFSRLEIKKLINQLTLHSGRFVFCDQKSAKRFAGIYLGLNRCVWCSPLQTALYYLLANAVKISLENNYLTKADLFTTDDLVTAKMKKAKDPEIIKIFKQLKDPLIKKVKKSENGLCLKSKVRIVDPLYLKNNRLCRLSQTDVKYRQAIKQAKKYFDRGFCLKILNPGT